MTSASRGNAAIPPSVATTLRVLAEIHRELEHGRVDKQNAPGHHPERVPVQKEVADAAVAIPVARKV